MRIISRSQLIQLFLLIGVFSLYTTANFACTTFVLNDGNELLFGRNLDWVSDNGVVVLNKSGVAKSSLVAPGTVSTEWISKYGSVSFNQFGAEFPFGGMNEKGLVVEIMLAPASYPAPDHRTALNELQWVQYQLDNCASVDDVLKTDEKIRIQKINQNLHFLICDASGTTAVIEFIQGEMMVYTGNSLPIPVLENDSYATSLENYNRQKSCRFTTAAKAFEQFASTPKGGQIEFAFNTLAAVALDASWSIVYDIKNREIYFNTASNRAISFFKFDHFDFSCQTPKMLFDLNKKRPSDISDNFGAFNIELNLSKMRDGIRTNAIRLPKLFIEALEHYPLTCECAH